MEDFKTRVRIAAINNPFWFIKYILGYNEISDIHKEMIDFIMRKTDDNRKLLLEPRFHFKTSVVTIGMTIVKILENPDIRILINSKILSNSKKILSEIIQHFESTKFIQCIGDLRGNIWRQHEISVKRKRIVKEPTISIGAVDHELTGGHYDLIINDDIAGLPDMISEVYREATLRFYKLLKYLGDKGTQEINIGTRWHVIDIYDFMIKQISKENILIRQAIMENGTVLFKERFTLEDLMKIKSEDPILFEAQMQNNPTAIGDQLYPLEKLKFFDYTAFNPDYNISYVDPAFGKYENKEPCYFSFIIGSIVGDNLYIMDWLTNRLKPEENELLIVEKIKQYSVRQIGIETNAQQSEFARNVKRVIDDHNRKHEFQHEKIFIDIKWINHTQNKDRRIQAMHGSVINKVYFRKDWQEVYEEGMKQLFLYPYHKFKDAPDALEGLIDMTKYKMKFEQKDQLIYESKKIFS